MIPTVAASCGTPLAPSGPEYHQPEVYQEWPFNAAEAKRRQQWTAAQAGTPVETALDLGNGVKLELVLIPAGRFIMGTPEPERVDEERFINQVSIGVATLASCVGVLLVLIGFVFCQAIRERRRPQISLARLLAIAIVAGIGLLGGLHWFYTSRTFAQAKTEHVAALARFDGAADDEKPAHEVTLTRPFYIGKYEVTQEQYHQVMEENPAWCKDPRNPVEQVQWEDAQEFCRRASRETGRQIRLPAEAEWEYACRAGTATVYHCGDDKADLDRVAWHRANSAGRPHSVGKKDANAFGLYDAHGNVWEWCRDRYGAYSKCSSRDPEGATDGVARVLRGGAWGVWPRSCSSAIRNWGSPESATCGFRVVVALRHP